MIPRKLQARPDKTRCDLCRRENPPIAEYRFNCRLQIEFACGCPPDGHRRKGCTGRHRKRHGFVTHWIDLCAACAARDYPDRNGFLIGIHEPVARGRSARSQSAKQNTHAREG